MKSINCEGRLQFLSLPSAVPSDCMSKSLTAAFCRILLWLSGRRIGEFFQFRLSKVEMVPTEKLHI